ncbi:MAG: hypothetical protein Q8867_08880 [Bacteroidota bacterium]|nr:hypothetical protein [Bacteroidota bacterium]
MVQYIYPLLLVFFAAILLTLGSLLILMYYFRQNGKKKLPNLGEDRKIIITLRLQAYERIVLFLERITPNNLVLRIQSPEMSSLQLQAALIQSIREEYEYNLSQQLYISSKAWELVRNAKEEVIRLINKAGGKLPETAPGAELIPVILELYLENERFAVNLALDKVKEELRKLF